MNSVRWSYDESIASELIPKSYWIDSSLRFTYPDWMRTWWRHQMETFSALLAICAGNSPVPGELLAQRPVTRSFDVFFDLRLNKRLSKQSWGWWFETLSRPLWHHCNELAGAWSRFSLRRTDGRTSVPRMNRQTRWDYLQLRWAWVIQLLVRNKSKCMNTKSTVKWRHFKRTLCDALMSLNIYLISKIYNMSSLTLECLR